MEQIKTGFARALAEYKPFGGSFPSVAEIRAYALRDYDHPRYADDTADVKSWQKPDPPTEEEKAEFRRRLEESLRTNHNMPKPRRSDFRPTDELAQAQAVDPKRMEMLQRQAEELKAGKRG